MAEVYVDDITVGMEGNVSGLEEFVLDEDAESMCRIRVGKKAILRVKELGVTSFS